MASAGARAYNGGLGAEPQRAGAEPLVRGSTEAESFSLHKYLTFAL